MIFKKDYIFYIVYLSFFLLATGCGTPTPTKHSAPLKNIAPKWVSNQNNIGSFRAVGSSPVNFQGMYMQRSQAMLLARASLSNNINVYITSIYESELKIKNETLSKRIKFDITAISSLLMKESYQIDAYVDENQQLFVLIETSAKDLLSRLNRQNKGDSFTLSPMQTRPYDITLLQNRRCYNQETLKKIKTVSPMYQGFPTWFYRPTNNGIIGSVGIAEKLDDSSFESQKKVATTLGKSALAKRHNIKINSALKISKISLHNEVGKDSDFNIKTKSISKIKSIIVKDIWMDPKKCELYTWIVEDSSK